MLTDRNFKDADRRSENPIDRRGIAAGRERKSYVEWSDYVGKYPKAYRKPQV